jgi:hypothetical protein
MAGELVQFTTPVARLVQGHPLKGATKDFRTGKPLTDSNGQPKTSYYIAIAIPKSSPELPALMQKLQQVAHRDFPQIVQPNGQSVRPDFAWKIVDGDSQIPNQNNTKPCDQTGFPGHMIFKFSGTFAPRVYRHLGGSTYEQVGEHELDALKTGDYIRVAGSTKGNDRMDKPGIYLNMDAILIAGQGEAIMSSVDPTEAFGTDAPALPQGATPISTPATGIPAVGGYTPPMNAMMPPVGAPAPAYDIADGRGAVMPPTGGGAVTPPAPPAEPKVNYQGAVHPVSFLKSQGWTDEQIAQFTTPA